MMPQNEFGMDVNQKQRKWLQIKFALSFLFCVLICMTVSIF